MLKELLINGYLQLFRFVFTLLKLLPQKKKITFVISFEENATYIHREMVRKNVPFEMVFLCKPSVSTVFQSKTKNTTIVPFESPNVIEWCKSIYHLATSKMLIVDNYFAFLSVINFKKNVECIQIWHAAGALKKFGLEDKTITNRSKSAIQRFNKVYEKFHKVVVGSDVMAEIFIDSFGLSEQNILRTGIPRTDFFYEEEKQTVIKQFLNKTYPMFGEKKKILYAPTFRDSQLNQYDIQLDIAKMHQELKDEYVLLIKLHPAVKTNHNYQEIYPDFVFDFSGYKGINELLVITDLLISDYSSVPFEYSLLEKPMIFFPYDLDLYQRERGVIPNYTQEVPGPVVFKTDEVIRLIKNNQFNLELVREFSHKWNEFSVGDSSEKLVEYILNQLR